MEPTNELFTAITTAVLAYIKAQEEQQLALAPATSTAVPPMSVSFWAASGRQAMMDMRRTLQLGLMRF
jgi:NADPH-dependent ferric siderophore reductase